MCPAHAVVVVPCMCLMQTSVHMHVSDADHAPTCPTHDSGRLHVPDADHAKVCPAHVNYVPGAVLGPMCPVQFA